MKLKRTAWICVAVLLVLCVIAFAIVMLAPRPIVCDSKGANIIEVSYVQSPDGETVSLSDYDKAEVFDCLSKYSWRQTLQRSNAGIVTGDYKLIIYFMDGNNKLKELYIGGDNGFYSEGGSMFRGKLSDEEQMLDELLEILNIED